jgi:hypothetical protein
MEEEGTMKKMLLVCLCLLLVPTLAMGFTYGHKGTVTDNVIGVPIIWPQATVKLYDTNAAAVLVGTVLTNAAGQYNVSKTVPFPTGSVFFTQKWQSQATSKFNPSVSSIPKNAIYTFDYNYPLQVRVPTWNFTCFH